MARKVNPGIVAKRGKLRILHKCPASKRSLEYQKVKYVRGARDLSASGVRLDCVAWIHRRNTECIRPEDLVNPWAGQTPSQVAPQPLPSLLDGYFEEACASEASQLPMARPGSTLRPTKPRSITRMSPKMSPTMMPWPKANAYSRSNGLVFSFAASHPH